MFLKLTDDNGKIIKSWFFPLAECDPETLCDAIKNILIPKWDSKEEYATYCRSAEWVDDYE